MYHRCTDVFRCFKRSSWETKAGEHFNWRLFTPTLFLSIFSRLAVVGSLKRSHFDLHIQDSTTIEDQINEINESIYMHITYNLYLITYIISICLTYFNQLTCISLNSLFWLLHPFLHSSSSFACNVRSPTKTKILISVVKTIKNISIKTCSQVLVFLMTDSWSRGLNT